MVCCVICAATNIKLNRLNGNFVAVLLALLVVDALDCHKGWRSRTANHVAIRVNRRGQRVAGLAINFINQNTTRQWSALR